MVNFAFRKCFGIVFSNFVFILIDLTGIKSTPSTPGSSITIGSLLREFVGQDTEDICLPTSLGLVRQSRMLINRVETKSWLNFCMLPIELLNLYPVKVW